MIANRVVREQRGLAALQGKASGSLWCWLVAPKLGGQSRSGDSNLDQPPASDQGRGCIAHWCSWGPCSYFLKYMHVISWAGPAEFFKTL